MMVFQGLLPPALQRFQSLSSASSASSAFYQGLQQIEEWNGLGRRLRVIRIERG
ncbi:MAG: hypothetical protein GY801_29885 [bacterium]|nr:hypothetical protein [bacterium]